MKTTIDLPDELFRQVRDYSRASGVTMRELMVDGLRAELASRLQPRGPVDFVFVAVEGEGLRADLEPGAVIASSYSMPSTTA